VERFYCLVKKISNFLIVKNKTKKINSIQTSKKSKNKTKQVPNPQDTRNNSRNIFLFQIVQRQLCPKTDKVAHDTGKSCGLS